MEQKPYNEYMQALAEKWLNGTITDAEAKNFAEWYNSFNDEDELKLESSFAANEFALKKRILEKLHAQLNGKAVGISLPYVAQQSSFISRNRWWLSAAVIAIIILFTIFYALLKPGGSTDTNIVQKDIQPGGNKAVLTLANGSAIILDSAANGSLAQQGTGQITKVAEGQIVYSDTKTGNKEVLYNTLSTPRGGQYQLRLPDGTDVWLNSASSIHYPTAFTGAQRIVEITGEVYFEVAKNEKMPFKVKVNSVTVEVLGTHFNINAYAEESLIKTTLLEGSVKVQQTVTHQSQIIKPGQQAQSDNSSSTIQVVSDIDMDQVMAWKTGFFEFDKTDITLIMRQISRWYDVEVSFEGEPSTEKFGGRISRTLPLSEVLKLLETNGVQCKVTGKKVIVF